MSYEAIAICQAIRSFSSLILHPALHSMCLVLCCVCVVYFMWCVLSASALGNMNKVSIRDSTEIRIKGPPGVCVPRPAGYRRVPTEEAASAERVERKKERESKTPTTARCT